MNNNEDRQEKLEEEIQSLKKRLDELEKEVKRLNSVKANVGGGV